MTKKKEDLKNEFKLLCDKYVQAFMDMYFDDSDMASYDWLTDDLIEVNDYFVNINTVKYCVDNNVLWEDFYQWYDYVLRVNTVDHNIPTPSIDMWVKGCPRRTEEDIENLESLHNHVMEAQRELEDAIERFTSKF